MPLVTQNSQYWGNKRDMFPHGLAVSQTGGILWMPMNMSVRNRNCVMSVEMKRSVAISVIKELDGMSDEHLEGACVFTLHLVHNHVSNPGCPELTESILVFTAAAEVQMWSSRWERDRFHIISSL